jgi:hypothetical protein
MEIRPFRTEKRVHKFVTTVLSIYIDTDSNRQPVMSTGRVVSVPKLICCVDELLRVISATDDLL